ncbi:MAG: RelA/SpoT family protein, partial [bacterium]
MTPEFQKEYAKLKRKIKHYHEKLDTKFLGKAYQFSFNAHEGQLRKSGDPYFVHCVEVAKILAEHRFDLTTIVSGLLHDVVEDCDISTHELRDEFGADVATLVDGVTKIGGLKFASKLESDAENFRKMIISMVKDIRVILIKFADRLHNMTTLQYLSPKKQKVIAQETKDVYAPLADRLGMANMKSQLEELAFKFLEPDVYRDLDGRVEDTREDRERYIRRVVKPIRRALLEARIPSRIESRPKSLSSIYHKMVVRNVPFEKIYDLSAIRIIVDDEKCSNSLEQCYRVLGIVHSLFDPFQEKFRDYIAKPRQNGYRSLHTAVFGPGPTRGRKLVEVQIRTKEMHKVAEEGIAAHWKYKAGKSKDSELDKYLVWLRQVVGSITESEPDDVLERFKIQLFNDEIFVFTPKGDLLKLPLGATAIDFAFAVHSDIGLHCIGAKINGKMESLRYQLKSGDSVEILTSPNQKPNPDWIKSVKTSKARSRIKRWLRESFYEQSVHLGEEILNKQFKKEHIKKEDVDLDEIAQSFSFQNSQQLLASIGRGATSIQTVVNRIVPESRSEVKDKSILQRFIKRARGSAKGVRVQGLDNLMINFGRCCQPVPGDSILGFITTGRGIVVHRSDCKNIINLLENPDRKIDVEWDVDRDKHFMVRLQLLGGDRKHFLRDVSESISQTDTNIVSIDMKVEDSVVYSNI